MIGLQPEVYDNNNLVVRANGDASFFNNETGQFFNEYNGENADELAQNYTNEGGRTLRPSK